MAAEGVVGKNENLTLGISSASIPAVLEEIESPSPGQR
jgi:hypothetical protein